MRKRNKFIAGLVLASGAAGACVDQLNVVNPNSPDVARAYATPALVEGVISGLGLLIFGPQRATESAGTQAKILSGENYASVANFGMAIRAAIPRGIISNDLGNDNQTGNIANWNSFSIASRTAVNAIGALDKLIKDGKTLGSPAQDARARSFGYWKLGEALGYLAIAYDSAAIPTVGMASDAIPPLVSYKDVAAAAIVYMDSAVNIANSANATIGANGWPLPSSWINGVPLSRADYIRTVRSYRARIRAGVARNPAERAAVDWAKIIDDANNGITADLGVTVSTASGWGAAYDIVQMYVTGGWHQIPMYYYGMADVSGAYDQWLATPIGSRVGFLVQTPDKRWPQGATRGDQQAKASTNALPAGTYFRNRPTGDDVPLVGPGNSMYDHRRWGVINIASGRVGTFVDYSKVENDMLAAEGYIRAGNFTAAAALINVSRERNGLSTISGITSATQPISATLSSCVPRVPAAPAFTSTTCGTIFEAMKYEKRMETAYTGYMNWYSDNRGWGDLLEGTTVEWPVPYQELQSRGGKIYSGLNRAPKGTYGF